jgi:hypothetical protein
MWKHIKISVLLAAMGLWMSGPRDCASGDVFVLNGNSNIAKGERAQGPFDFDFIRI